MLAVKYIMARILHKFLTYLIMPVNLKSIDLHGRHLDAYHPDPDFVSRA